MNVSPIKLLLDNRRYEGYPQNSDVDDLSFDGDERFIGRQRLYPINDHIVFR